MSRILLCWLGMADLRGAEIIGSGKGQSRRGHGPIAGAVDAGDYSEIEIVSDQKSATNSSFGTWLEARGAPKPRFHRAKLTSPTNFGEIHQAAVAAVEAVHEKHGADAPLTFHLSPGTPAMAAVWILLAKTRFSAAELIESSPEAGVKVVSVPFDISAEYLPDLLRKPDSNLQRLSEGRTVEAPEFKDIVFRCSQMRQVVDRAQLVAVREVPVLLLGETGTGKELFANAIHRASLRKEEPFVPVNCGAIPRELVDSELFGHEKGAFTGADRMRKGCFEEADGGTLFLDEIGELPLEAQVKLLRALQEGEVRRLGAPAKAHPINVRIVAATHRDLREAIESREFREDLFFRIAVGVLNIPPLRERKGDIGLLIEHLLAVINKDAVGQLGYKEKKLSPQARNLLLKHPWPGNVRELLNTLTRATIWSPSGKIGPQDVRDSLLTPRRASSDLTSHPLGESFKLLEFLAEIEKAYLSRAWVESGERVKAAAELLGFPNYKNFTDRMAKYGLRD